MRQKLTDLSVRSLKPRETTYAVLDTSLRGFGIRVGKYRKTWMVMTGTDRARTTLGHYPDLPLSEARRKAMAFLSEKKQPETTHMPFSEAFRLYLDTHVLPTQKRSSQAQITRLHKRRLYVLDTMDIRKITTRDINDIVDPLKDRPTEHNNNIRYLKAFFTWCVRRNLIDKSPCENLLQWKTPSRERVLSDAELKAVWHASLQLGQYGQIVRFLILSGCRKGEVTGLRWSDINDSEKTITIADTKNNRPHTFPCGDMLASLIEQISRSGERLFPSATSSGAFTHMKNKLDELSGVKAFVLHDLRRTFATNLASIGVRVDVTEKLLNHLSGSFAGIVSVYQRHTYLAEMRDAIKLWEERLQKLLQPNLIGVIS